MLDQKPYQGYSTVVTISIVRADRHEEKELIIRTINKTRNISRYYTLKEKRVRLIRNLKFLFFIGLKKSWGLMTKDRIKGRYRLVKISTIYCSESDTVAISPTSDTLSSSESASHRPAHCKPWFGTPSRQPETSTRNRDVSLQGLYYQLLLLSLLTFGLLHRSAIYSI